MSIPNDDHPGSRKIISFSKGQGCSVMGRKKQAVWSGTGANRGIDATVERLINSMRRSNTGGQDSGLLLTKY